MKISSLIVLAAVTLSSLPVFAVNAATLNTLQVNCEVPGFGITLKLAATLSSSRPEDHIEQYVFHGIAEYVDDRGTELEFKRLPVNGTFDNSRGVKRISFGPDVPLMFNTFVKISITEFQNGHQLFRIVSAGRNGPNGGSNGSLCQIIQTP